MTQHESGDRLSEGNWWGFPKIRLPCHVERPTLATVRTDPGNCWLCCAGCVFFDFLRCCQRLPILFFFAAPPLLPLSNIPAPEFHSATGAHQYVGRLRSPGQQQEKSTHYPVTYFLFDLAGISRTYVFSPHLHLCLIFLYYQELKFKIKEFVLFDSDTSNISVLLYL